MFSFWKTAKAIANLFMLFMTWRWYQHSFGIGQGISLTPGLGLEPGYALEFSASCIILSGMWLALSFAQMKHLMLSYATILSRVQLLAPLWLGIALNVLALAAASGSAFASGAITAAGSASTSASGAAVWLQLTALAGLIAWGFILRRYLADKKAFFAHGHGVLPQGIMVNPPAAMLPPGSILLMTGIPEYIGEAVGHGEIVIPDGDKKWAFSTYMKYGVVLNPLEEVLVRRAKRGITVALAPVTPWSEEQCKMAPMVAKGMLRQNKEWVVRRRVQRERLFDALHLPQFARALANKLALPITGYDWFGLLLGRTKTTHYTCVGSVQELLWRMGITLDRYFGTGLLGLGTTVLDPVMPARFFNLKCYRTITVDDYQAWLKTQEQTK